MLSRPVFRRIFSRLPVQEFAWCRFANRVGTLRAAIRRHAATLEKLSASDLREQTRELVYRAKLGETDSLVAPSFALVCESVRRTHGMTPYDVQLQAGICLTRPTVVEMATGEGKSLSVLLPLFYFSLRGKGVLLATANDYLAERDAEFAGTVFSPLGISVGVVLDRDEDEQRRRGYSCDVTYGTASQFGFDFLRDRAKRNFCERQRPLNPPAPVMRGSLDTILVDEIDSLLIDEAATPLVISSSPPPLNDRQAAGFTWAASHSHQAIEDVHYRYRKIEQQPELTDRGIRWMHQISRGLKMGIVERREILERAILVQRDFERDRHYLVDEGQILLVDQSTGRVGKGRQWSRGIHQAIQAKEGLPITMPNGQLARVTLQSFFNSFSFLSGMTGTARTAANEFRAIYQLKIESIPTHRKCLRLRLPTIGQFEWSEWLESIVAETGSMIQKGRSVLIGTRSIGISERVSSALDQAGICHHLLNARNDSQEADIVSAAGQIGRVTVATNMAGRGTDIKLAVDVKQQGGLHVILAGIHESQRIDRQLIGRAGRQGDPGSYRTILCLKDDLLDLAFETATANRYRDSIRGKGDPSAIENLFQIAQQALERKHSAARRSLFYQEKTQLKHLARIGLDPLLDLPD